MTLSRRNWKSSASRFRRRGSAQNFVSFRSKLASFRMLLSLTLFIYRNRVYDIQFSDVRVTVRARFRGRGRFAIFLFLKDL